MARPPVALEWAVGLASLPSRVDDEDGAYHPEILLWIAETGPVIDFHLGPPGTLLARAAEHLHDSIEKAQRDGASLPTSLRVSSPELAAELRASDLPLPVVTSAPTPEVDAAVADLASRLSRDEPSYLSVDIEPKHVAAFFTAAARLYRAKPWRSPSSGLHYLDIEELGVKNAVVTLLGATAEQFALVFFPTLDAFHTFIDADPASPSDRTAFTFVRTGDLHRARAEEVELWGWELATAAAAPEVTAIERGVTRDVTLAELGILEATLLAMERLSAGGSLATDETRHAVTTGAGSIEVRLRPGPVKSSAPMLGLAPPPATQSEKNRGKALRKARRKS